VMDLSCDDGCTVHVDVADDEFTFDVQQVAPESANGATVADAAAKPAERPA